jgi:ankyrin repeat protein
MESKSNEEVAEFFNGVTDALGNHALHICSLYGSCTYSPFSFHCLSLTLQSNPDDVMDALFDIQYFECDPLTRTDKDTPLHIAVRFANDKDKELGTEMVKMMCEAGCDPRVRNKHGQKPADLVFDNNEVKSALAQAEYILAEGMREEAAEDEGEGSASDSD